jgi:hypothetical protein
MVTKNDVGQIELPSGIVAIEAYFQFERAVFVLKISFRFRLLQLNRQCLDE